MAAAAGDAHAFPIFNARFRLVVPLLDADGDLVTGAAGLDTELSQDQGTFADATNEATEIATSSGMYYLDLVAGELDTKSTAVIVKTSTTGAKTTPVVLYPRRLPVLRTGTAQAGGGSTITLDAGASAIDNFYNGCYVNITNNTPTNALGQARRITGYVGSTKVATVEAAWGTNPSSSSTFEVLLPGDVVQAQAWGGTEVDPATAGIPKVNATHAAGTAWNSGAIGASTLAADAITAAKIADGAIDAATFASGAITATAIAADAITAAKVADGTIDAATFASAAITATAIASDAITAAKIATGAITNAKFAAGAIDAAAIAADAIGASELAADAVAEIATALWAVLPVGSVATDGGNSATTFKTDRTEATNDYWKDALLLITSGALVGQVKKVSAYNGTTKVVTVSGGFTGTPADGVTFILVNR